MKILLITRLIIVHTKCTKEVEVCDMKENTDYQVETIQNMDNTRACIMINDAISQIKES